MMANFVDQDLEHPGPAIGAGFETMKGFPCLQVCVLHQILCRRSIANQMDCRPKQISHVRQRSGLELSNLDFSAQ
jgi:hypothetical protein